MEEEKRLNKLCGIGLSAAYLIFTYQYAKYKGLIPIIDWLPEIIYIWLIIIGIFGGCSALSFLLLNIIIRLGGGFFAMLFGIFGFHAAWFCFLFSIKK